LLARLEHPHIVPLYDYRCEAGIPYFINRFCNGGCLADRISVGQPDLPVPFILQVLEQIASALDYVHRLGMVHRDIKPRNILLDEDGNVYLSHFGIAKYLLKFSSEDLAQDQRFKGTPAYASPEQFNFRPVSPQSDVYALGIMTYEMLCGCLPFQASTPWGYCLMHTGESLPSLAAVNPELAPILDPILGKATAKDPLDRFPDVPSLVLALGDALAGLPVSIREYGAQSVATPVDLVASETNRL
jgi:serine/threonine-protein kinase